MADDAKRPNKRRAPGGRVTPKGSRPGDTPGASTRYTPPIPAEVKVSPRWVPYVMFGLLGIGSLLIVVNYLGVLPGGTSNGYLLVGLGLILGSIIAATQWR